MKKNGIGPALSGGREENARDAMRANNKERTLAEGGGGERENPLSPVSSQFPPIHYFVRSGF